MAGVPVRRTLSGYQRMFANSFNKQPELLYTGQTDIGRRLSPCKVLVMLRKTLSVVLGLAIVCVIGAIVYLAVVPKIGDKFTEFYILGTDGKAENYPREVKVGQEAQVILGMVNHEYQSTSYRVEIAIDGLENKEIGSIVLANGEKWQEEVSFTPTTAGDNQKVEFLLYKSGQVEPYQSLRLWIDVST